MADNKLTKPSDQFPVKDIAGGWITEKQGTDVPAFLKACYFVIFSSAAIYLVTYIYGEVSHADRGPLVQEFNKSTSTSEGLMYAIAVLCVLFFIGMIIFVFGKPHED